MVAVYKLIDMKYTRYLFKVNTTDGISWVATFLVALILGVEQGILTGVILSLLFFIWEVPIPVQWVGLLESEDVFRDVDYHTEAKVDRRY